MAWPSRDELSTRGSKILTPGLTAALGRQKPGGFCSFHPCAGHEGGLRSLGGSRSLAFPRIWFTSLSGLVILASSVACSLCFLVFCPNFPSFEHLQSILSVSHMPVII